MYQAGHEIISPFSHRCVYDGGVSGGPIRSEVPKGATVCTKDPLWAHQRLSELSTLWAVPQAKRADARYWLTFVSARGHCGGLEPKVSRL